METSEVFKLIISGKYTHATFGIHGAFENPDEITSRMNMKPSYSFGKGEEFIGHLDRHTKGVRHRPIGTWMLASISAIESHNPLDHVHFIVNSLEPKLQAISELRTIRGYRAHATINEARWEGKLGYTFPSELLSRLCRLCDDISFTTNTIDEPPDSVA